jgi:hypothetical protein
LQVRDLCFQDPSRQRAHRRVIQIDEALFRMGKELSISVVDFERYEDWSRNGHEVQQDGKIMYWVSVLKETSKIKNIRR